MFTFKNLAEIISGKRSRQLRLQGPAFSEAMDRFKSSKLVDVPIAKNFSTALGFTTSTMVEQMLLESKVAFLTNLSKSLDSDALRDLAAFASWWLVTIYHDNAKELAKDDAEAAKSLDQWLEITMNVRDTMYPLTERAQKAVEAYHDAEERLLQGAGVQPTAEAVRIAVGLEPVNFDSETVEVLRQDMDDGISVGSVFVGCRGLLAETFGVLQGNR